MKNSAKLTAEPSSAARTGTRVAAAAAAVACALGALTGLAQPASAAGCATALRGDLNGDGHADAVVTEYGRTRLQGGIHVLYGTAKGLTADASGTAPDDQFLTQDSPGVPGTSEPMDEWGASLATGDFNGDKCADLAVGAPGEDGSAGGVTILYGSPTGLVTTGSQRISQNSTGVPGIAEPNDRFASALTVGDFDKDGRADLAVGVPGEVITKVFQAGSVTVLYGSPTGLTRGRASAVFFQGSDGVGGTAEEGDRFGAALAAGDFYRSGVDALAIGVPGENRSGALQVLKGGPQGLAGKAAEVTRKTTGVPGEPVAGDVFAGALAAGDLDGDGAEDLAVGIPGDNARRGAVSVLYSAGTTGLTGAHTDYWTQDTPGVGGTAAPGDGFGSSLATGRLDAGDLDDLAIGVPSDTVGTVVGAGAVNMLMGSKTGLTSAGPSYLHQDVSGVTGRAATGDRFGLSVTVARVNGSGIDNLMVGIPAEGLAGTATQHAGAFEFFGNGENGPSATGSRLWTLEQPGVQGASAPGVYLGYALA
jgi:hypothetical protein